jgi:hypothetical protein
MVIRVCGQCRRMRRDETTQVTAYLCARGRLAGAQQHGDRPACRRVVDVDRHETALVVMSVEQRELLMPMNDIHCIVDIEGDRRGRRLVAGAVEIDHYAHHADQIAQGRHILPP